jgi:flavorubredoxin
MAELIAEGTRFTGDEAHVMNANEIPNETDLEGKSGGAFGAFGWSGEASCRIYETMENIFKMDMMSGPLRLKSSGLEGVKQMAQDYGREVGKKLAQYYPLNRR